MSEPLILRLVASSVSVANMAGRIIRDILKTGDLGIVEKGLNDLQTEADRNAQKCIVSSLMKAFPDVAIIGEETLDYSDVNPDWITMDQDADVLKHAGSIPDDLKNISAKDICIWVDPLDGTAEFTQGLLDHVTVLIGIAVKEKAVAGVIYQPYYNYQNGPQAELGRTIWGIVGLGAFGFEQVKPPAKERIITTTRSHMDGAVKGAIDACQPTKILRVGGAGHKVLLLIEGKAHAYLFASPGCKKWDTCAPEAVLHAMGGKLTDVNGNFYQYHSGVKLRNDGGTLATCLFEDHPWYLSKMPEAIRCTLKSK
ncbi:hypothetical protein HELRODRAFT_186138 [Helobdella robusta]|uniref:3'(2'),5'-bisphosphate nucleotidase 1 n=1 Tax=Helobdella robusta TaxID=6412 RepID=T1FNP9_HELRO|nr:hypothetical protein HELRODRAFT_186138 [Helobdella robusta]ESN92499.1 hypothetical protein HELRODRAFT_186138 [Helobdella robusta]